jgi:hypothetical protein
VKYFPYSLIAAANDWDESAALTRAEAEIAFTNALQQYFRQLERLRGRVSKAAWEFFRHGSGERGLHDARLLMFTIGDGLSYVPDGSAPFRLNRQAAEARIEFINYEQTFHYEFRAAGIRRSTCTFEADDFYSKRRLGDLYLCELTVSDDDHHLALGFLFADGAEISLEFRKLIFRRSRLRRTYPVNAMYD